MGRSKRRNRPPVSSNFKPHPMPASTTPDIQAVVQEAVSAALTKALAIPSGGTATTISPSQLQMLRMQSRFTSSTTALDRDPYSDLAMLGPGLPLLPVPLDPLLPSGRPAPRRWQAPPSWNLQTTTTRKVPWELLRDAADNVSIVKSCIETCKSALTGLPWSFGVDSARARVLAKRSNTSSHAVIADLQDKFADDIDRLHQFWLKPDRISNWTFVEWLTALLDDELTLDAVAVYPHLQMNGDLHSLEILDSATIKPLLDHRAATPQPPWAAFQQILWGFPRGEYSQANIHVNELPDGVDAQFVSAVYGPVKGTYAPTDALIYKVRNRRSGSPYGYSCVEQALPDIDLYLKRQEWLRAEFNAGVIPQMVVNVDSSMTAEQMREWQSILNDALSGNTGERHRATFMPQGFTASYPAGFEAKYSSDLDMQMIKLICASFGVMPTSLGFMPTGRGGSSGGGSSGSSSGRSMQLQQDAQLERSTKPRAEWVVDIINEISINYLGMPPEVTFAFHGLDDQDEQRSAELLESYIDTGLMVLNEGRDQLNLPRFNFPEANEPFLNTPTGPSFLNPEVKPVQMPGNLPSAAQNQPGFKPDQEPESPPGPRDEQVQDVPDDAAKLAEQKAFLAFVAKSDGPPDRSYAFCHQKLDVAIAANELASQSAIVAIQALFKDANAGRW